MPDQPKARRLPSEHGAWLFIICDLVLFGALIWVFLHYRSAEPEVFLRGQAALHPNLGALNTAILIISSLCVAKAVEHIRTGRMAEAQTQFRFAILLGCAFCAVKVIEYSGSISAGNTAFADNFYLYYFILTGTHLTHVLMGLLGLAFLLRRTRSSVASADEHALYESGGIYWHMVDLLWIVLFPIIYLVK